MKIAVIILLFALGVMWYRGDIGSGHRPSDFGLPATIPKALTADSVSAARNSGKTQINDDAKIQLLTGQDVAMLSGKDREAYDKWATKRQQERTISDKLLNFFSHGKYE